MDQAYTSISSGQRVCTRAMCQATNSFVFEDYEDRITKRHDVFRFLDIYHGRYGPGWVESLTWRLKDSNFVLTITIIVI